MKLPSVFLCIVGVALVSSAVSADDASSSLEKDKLMAKELAVAMQSAQLLLSNLADIFECDYSGYDVKTREFETGSIYLVVIDVNKDSCTDMVEALNEQGAEDMLAFVTERRIPQMKPLQSPHNKLTPDPLSSPEDYTLINEIDP